MARTGPEPALRAPTATKDITGLPNAFALFALIAWPAASALLFRALSIPRALIASLLLAYLFLPPPPAGFDFPLLPALTKDTIPNMVVVVICLALAREPIQWLPAHPLGKVLVLIFVLSPIVTVISNAEPVFYGRVGLPGLRLREAIALCMQQALFVAPMLLARHFIVTERHRRDVMVALMLCGLLYSLPALVEVRLSPQLNLWVYGYYQHSFEQTIRFGGYRPLVFLYHGIWLAFFLMTTAFAALALMRAEQSRAYLGYAAASAYLLVVLFLCKSAGALIFAAAFAPVIAFAGRKMQLHIAVALAFLAVAYPAMKGADIVPVDRMLAAAEEISIDRANSLRFRFDNEDILLERAFEKPLFGWGSWGRNHILDPETGRILTVTDGRWIIVIGVFGWLGFIAEFGLLTLPIFVMWWRGIRGDAGGMSPFAGPLALMLAINVVDLIPNATITPVTFILAGTLLGYAERYSRRRPVRTPVFQTIL